MEEEPAELSNIDAGDQTMGAKKTTALLDEKPCTKCGKVLPATPEYFPRSKRAPRGIYRLCHPCSREKCREWAKNNPEKKKESRTRSFLKTKIAVFRHYSNGDPHCACCGEVALEFLSMDHINGDGAEHRRAMSPNTKKGYGRIYHWLKKNEFPDGFRVLCFNCNMARGIFGYCPHERENGG